MNLPSDPLESLKDRVKWMWSQGDYASLALRLEPEAIALADRCGIKSGSHVLDVAAGNGNFAVAAARRGAQVTATDLTPRMIELGRERTALAAPTIEWLEADAEDLPFPDAEFDLAASVFGAMFAPRPELVAGEMFRVVRPGGVVAMANYGSEGFLARFAGLMARYTPPSPIKLPSPFSWGDRTMVVERMGGLASTLDVEERTLVMRFDSFAEWREMWERTNPTLMTLKKMLPAPDYERFMEDARGLITELTSSPDGPLLLESKYLSVLARR